ncbi:MAG: 30S ribosomal protein S4 [Candidatus Pacebacteria bacterium CG_4_10_14_3_um_filter_34_15]|nr:MAG: 30S ribosomal protein S4 [Candidatus Pacebacteria bacterium CG_4_10_14_3_um_filter_34_15]
MARYIGPKNKLARKIGEDLGLKTNALKVARRLTSKPGQHGAKSRRKTSDYGTQLNEKQKVKYIYGILERQLRKLYTEASKNPTATGAALLSLLERRLDNAIYRLGWTGTRAAARQLASHSHIRINGKKMDVPSYQVKVNDIISLTSKGMKIPLISEAIKENSSKVTWLEQKGAVAKVSRLPERTDVTESIEEQLIVEYYSR